MALLLMAFGGKMGGEWERDRWKSEVEREIKKGHLWK